MCGIKKSPRSEVAVPHSGACEVRRLLAGATALLLRVAWRGSRTASIVRRAGLVAEPGVLRVEVPPIAHPAQSQVELLVGAVRRIVRRDRVGHCAQLLPDLHFSLQ